ncbi:MAG TPA: hypothetical protein VMV94_11910, partial [Phycisphaerae bacterium]|nr:hypothetical protein [Phycisphaerae bacterium]
MLDDGSMSRMRTASGGRARRAVRGAALRLATLAAIAVSFASGCAERNGVLEIDSGAPVGQAAGARGGTMVYAVHAGEDVTMRFRSRVGTCDYAIMYDESKGQYEDCGPCVNGQFEWKYAVGRAGATEQPLRLTVTGYVQQGLRDRMPFKGQLVGSDRPNDEPDYKLAEASVLLRVYQSVVEIPVRLPSGRPDWNLTKLIVVRGDGQQTRISKAAADERGFEVTGPDEEGMWLVRYEPKAAEVSRAGETLAVLRVADEDGQITAFQQAFATP